MLPLYLLTNARGQQLSVELKSGEIVEGILVNVDNWMNLTLSNVKEYKKSLLLDASDSSNKEDVEIIKLKEIYLKGIYIKYIKLQDNIIDSLKQQIHNNNANQNNRDSNRGDRNYHKGGNNRYNRDNRNYNNSNQGNRRYYNKHDMNRRNYNNTQDRQYHNQSQQQQQQLRNQHESIPQRNNGMGGYVQYHGGDINQNNTSHSNNTIEF